MHFLQAIIIFSYHMIPHTHVSTIHMNVKDASTLWSDPGEITPCNLRYTPELRGYLMWGYLPLFLCFRWPYIYIKSYSGRILGTLWCFINSYMGWITWSYVTYKQYGCIFSSLVHHFCPSLNRNKSQEHRPKVSCKWKSQQVE